ncbi:hypothetical protein O6R05_07150 [Peptoniphilus equinus]|uniref:Uncharacterized protein n=1 Tax=Peptoniphilus equinus TaxID=3016343 RepID=A0ABY7QSK5_9FIRM|nr:hypothetical protein [Peptoniphilus equinus]WBW49773.1 hypothetical protein O6R05_07150 [Peptoniphilus equinus]
MNSTLKKFLILVVALVFIGGVWFATRPKALAEATIVAGRITTSPEEAASIGVIGGEDDASSVPVDGDAAEAKVTVMHDNTAVITYRVVAGTPRAMTTQATLTFYDSENQVLNTVALQTESDASGEAVQSMETSLDVAENVAFVGLEGTLTDDTGTYPLRGMAAFTNTGV